MSTVKKNYIYNILYQFLVVVFPIIIIPYVSRIIGPKGIGIYSYTHSIVYYFVIISMLGISNYGNRTIARCRSDSNKVTNEFLSIYLIQFCMSLIMSFIYILYIIFFCEKYTNIFIFQIIYLLSCLFDISWFYFGLEKFKFTTSVNIIVKFLNLIAIFLFVKNKNDLWIYTLIMTSSILLSNLVLWFPLKRYLSLKTINKKYILRLSKTHFFPCLKLFIPVIAVSFYKYMDKIMLGQFSNITDVALYENAEKVISIPICLITSLGTVMLPRMSNLFSKHESKLLENTICKSIEFAMFLAFPISMGLIIIARDFSILFFGGAFAYSGVIIQYLAISNIFISWANVIRTQYIIPSEKDNIYIYAVILGAIINFILNLILINIIGVLGVVIATIFSEFIVMFVQNIMVRKNLPIFLYIKKSFKFFISGIIMYVLVIILTNIIRKYINDSFFIIVFQIFIGIVIYTMLNVKYILLNLKTILRR